MPLGDYLAGVAWLVVTVVPVLVATWLIQRRFLAHLRGSVAVLAYSLVATTGLIAVYLLPGLVALLYRGAVAITSLLLLAAVACASRGARPSDGASGEPGQEPPADSGGRPAWVLAGVAVALLVLYALAFLIARGTQAVTAIDALTFDVPGIVRWIQEGTIWPVHQYWYGWGLGNYPMNGELIALSVMLPFHTDAWLRFVSVPYLALSGIGVYALARELGARSTLAVSFGATFAATPSSLLTALDFEKPDPIMVATFTAAAVFALRHLRTRARSDLVLAAVGIGIGFGTKWYGVSYGAVAVVFWLGALLVSRWPLRAVVRCAGIVVGVIAAVGGFWLLRNTIQSGSPLFPAKVALFGVTIFDAPPDRVRQQIGFPILHYAHSGAGVWRPLILPALRDAFGLPGILAVAGVAAALVVNLVRRVAPSHAARTDWRVAGLALLALVLLAVYAATPYTAQGADGHPLVQAGVRYGLPPLALASAVAAWAGGRTPRIALIVQLACIAAVVDGIAHVDNLGFVPYLRHIVEPGRVAAAVLVIALVCAVVLTLRWRAPSRPALAGLVAAVAVALAVGGGLQQDHYQRHRYAAIDPTIDWLDAHAPTGRHVAIGGRGIPSALAPFPLLPFSGPRFGNRVELIGPVRRDLLYYPGGRGEFARQVEARRYDTLLILRRPARPRAPELAWSRALGFVPVAQSPSAVLLVRR